MSVWTAATGWTQRLVPSRGLAVFRIGWGIAALLTTHSDWGRVDLYNPAKYHDPLAFVPAGVPHGLYVAEVVLAAAASLCTLAGAWGRIGAWIATACFAHFLASDLLLFRNHIYLLCLLGGLLGCSQCDRSLSVTRTLRKHDLAASTERVPAWPIRLIQMQILIVYGFAVANKIVERFLDGWALSFDLRALLPASPSAHLFGPGWVTFAQRMLLRPQVSMSMAWGATLVEALLVVGLVARPLRSVAIAAGIAMHLAFYLAMNVITFGTLMVSSYALFVAYPLDEGLLRFMRDFSRGPRAPPIETKR